MQIRSEEISSLIQSQIKNYGVALKMEETGTVISAGDGIARVYGLNGCMSGELLTFENDIMGMAINLEEDNVGCILLGSDSKVMEGSAVTRTGETVSVPVGDGLLSRVVDPLGRPLDGRGPIESSARRPVEFAAPGVMDRKSVDTPLQTGIMAIDSMIPIGRGQRELIIGDRQTGKTSIALDTIINQKGKDVICIYVGIGQKNSTIVSLANTLKKHGAMDYTIVVTSPASDPASLQYLAPYSGCAMAEEFMYNQNKDVLVVYDDLSKHAVAYRAISLLLRRPPGREAYPGDVFYLHSRLLERAAQLSDELGGGSITALPIIETQASDFSAYIPTNVVSITDGQIYLMPNLFFSGQRPAINVGVSVSRVGGAAQTKAMKKVSGSLRINLAQYRELEVFAQFDSDLDKSTKDKLIKGERMLETLKQPLNDPLSVSEQVITLYAASGTALMDIPVKEVKRFNESFHNHVKANCPEICEEIDKKGILSKEHEQLLSDQLAAFKQDFNLS